MPLVCPSPAARVHDIRWALECTLLAWIRTGLFPILFGFTICKFFQLQEFQPPFRRGGSGLAVSAH